jgi:Protein of unknown function (DUF669)
MSESNIVMLPPNWDDIETEFSLVAEGKYDVTINRGFRHCEGGITFEFQITDGGPFANRHLFQRYGLDTMAGARQFKALLEAIHVEPVDGAVDLARCTGKTLSVTVKHNEKDDKTYANVVAHRALPEG